MEKNKDFSFARSAYSLYAFEQEDIPTQKDNIVQVTIKNENDSVTFLMDMMESVDQTFIESYFEEEDAKGNLYKRLYQGGPADFSRTSVNNVSVETPSWTPIYDLKTNDDEPDHSLLESFVHTIDEDKRSANDLKRH